MRWIGLLTLMFAMGSAQAFGLGDLDKLSKGLKKAKEIKEDTKYLRGAMDEDEERKIGRDIAATLLAAAPPVDDEALQLYVNQVGRWVASQSERPDLEWTFGILDTDSINAFATPGGYVFVTKPLFLLLNSEAELAGVLGHEIAHVVEKHHIIALQKAVGTKYLMKGLLKAGEKNMDDDDVEVLDKVLGAGKELYTKGLDRKDEYEADRNGVVLAARAGYNPYGFLDTLATLNTIDPSDKSLALLTNTHPSTTDRLEALDPVMDKRLGKYVEQKNAGNRFRQYKASLLQVAEN